MTHMLKNENIDHENKKLFRNAYMLRKKLLWNTNQNFHFSLSLIF